jgi:hypothetical protein
MTATARHNLSPARIAATAAEFAAWSRTSRDAMIDRNVDAGNFTESRGIGEQRGRIARLTREELVR